MGNESAPSILSRTSIRKILGSVIVFRVGDSKWMFRLSTMSKEPCWKIGRTRDEDVFPKPNTQPQ
ncbi:MAG: hypothetical protein LBQ66_09175 [Planctomycetaceae bacterium]|nr:hypothetical protein [Planctomycetaceae bacterium]